MQLQLPLAEPIAADVLQVAEPPTGTHASPPHPDGVPWRFDAGACVFVRHRRAKRYILRLDATGRVRVTIPRGGSRREAAAFAERQREWIVRERARVMNRTPAASLGPELLARARSALSARLLSLATHLRLPVTRVSVRNQRTRWGSCGRDGHVCLNWRLVLMPDWVSDYVMIHELMHLRRMDHSPAYWKLVAAACPDYLAARQWLRVNGAALR